MRTLGAVLAGGRSSRFGTDKALAEWHGRALIDHVVDRLTPAVDAVVICGRHHGDLPMLADRPAHGLGPLPAINAALHHAASHGFARVVTLPCDVPAVAATLLARLLASPGAAFVAGMPVIGVWPAALAPGLDAWLSAGDDRAIRRWAISVGGTPLAVPPNETPANVNWPADLSALDRDQAELLRR